MESWRIGRLMLVFCNSEGSLKLSQSKAYKDKTMYFNGVMKESYRCNLLNDCSSLVRHFVNLHRLIMQLELPRPIPRNSVESDHGCTWRIYFDNAGDNVTLTLYNVTLTSQHSVNTMISVIAAKQTVINE